MKRFLRKLSVVFLISLLISPAFSQISVDPTDEFYELAQSWEIRGLVKALPPIRPYSLNSIRNIIQNVIKRGNPSDADIAIAYWQQITGKPWNIDVEYEFDATAKKETEKNYKFGKVGTITPAITGDSYIYKDLMSIGYNLGVTVRGKEDDSPYRPIYTNSKHDARQDAANLGPFYGYIDLNSVASVGNDEVFVQAGLNRSGFGPFLNNGLALNESSYHSANLSFTLMKKNLFYAQQYSAIGATRAYDGGGLKPNKFMAFHTIGYNFTQKFSASYYENIIWGNRFDLSYLLPVPYMAAQGIGGNSDNLQMGLIFKYKPVPNLMWATDLFIDDLDVNKLVKLNFNGKNRFGLQTGLTYAPSDMYCRTVSFTYTAISPYTYSHWDYKTYDSDLYNYQNYTNNGVKIGAPYEPNSDIFAFNISFKPTNNLRIGVATSFMRHANICESDNDDEAFRYMLAKNGTYATDGSILTHSMFFKDDTESDGEHVKTAWDSLNFLNQKTKMYVVKAGLNLDYTLPKSKFGSLTFNFGYTFEYIRNKGVDSNMFPGGGVTANGDGTYAYNGSGSYSKSQIVDSAKREWRRNLHDEINNYLTIGITYRF